MVKELTLTTINSANLFQCSKLLVIMSLLFFCFPAKTKKNSFGEYSQFYNFFLGNNSRVKINLVFVFGSECNRVERQVSGRPQKYFLLLVRWLIRSGEGFLFLGQIHLLENCRMN